MVNSTSYFLGGAIGFFEGTIGFFPAPAGVPDATWPPGVGRGAGLGAEEEKSEGVNNGDNFNYTLDEGWVVGWGCGGLCVCVGGGEFSGTILIRTLWNKHLNQEVMQLLQAQIIHY